MKKALILLVAALAMNVKAQEVRYGVKAGLNLADMYAAVSVDDVEEVINTKSKTSFYVGGFVEFPLSEMNELLTGEVGLQYVGNGTKISKIDFSDIGLRDGNGNRIRDIKDLQLNFNQINMPFAVKYEVVQGLKIKAGGYFGYLISLGGKLKYEGKTRKIGNILDKTTSIYDGYTTTEYKASELFKRFDFGLNAGAEYNFVNGLFAEANYTFGLQSFVDDADIDEGEKLKNRVFQIGLGYKF
ncbi:PorT family protein [Ornithobacterium rhinotracheale]|uniref:PorT family protein n=1 Tax=Ornithobacterium rhinotracheale TaxID=28251 RepID=A0A410JTQ8_ORNRH|nr:porin family protein [Ornithobacterium rhinotracheale]QAR30016.1 PorT family protein [Ornithobacterium rhinotracheale]QAR31597.1 PorT family protein [Ornithobacterium rhinotracheale]